MTSESYWQQVRALEERHRPRSRRVIPYLAMTARSGLARAASDADDHAEALGRLDPPTEAAANHREYVDALRAVARDARELAEQKGWRAEPGILTDLRALPSFHRMVESRNRLLGRSEG